MRLFVTVVAAPGLSWTNEPPVGPLSPLPTCPVELMLDAEVNAGAAIATWLADQAQGPARFWIEGEDLRNLRVGEPPLVNGAVIVATPLDGPAPLVNNYADHELVFSVLSGPDAGELRKLRRGQYSIGRAGNSICIGDAQLSRNHAVLTVEASKVQISDSASANGTWVNRRRISKAQITTASTVQMGSTLCALRFSDDSIGPLPEPNADPSEPLVISRDTPPQRRGTMVVTAVLPVAIGVGLALATGMWIFLAFSAMSAISMLLPLAGGRARRKKFRRDLEAAQTEDYERRLSATPFLADTIRCTIGSTVALAQRGNTDRRQIEPPGQTAGGLMGWLRLGTAAQPANLRIDPPDPNFVAPSLPALPVALDIARVGQLAVSGPEQVVAAVLRSLALQIFQWSTPAGSPLVFCGRMSVLPLSGRFLPHARLTASMDDALSVLAEGRENPGFLFMDQQCTITAEQEQTVSSMVANARLNVVWYGDPPHRDVPATMKLSGQSATLQRGQEKLVFTPDMVSVHNFDRYCRARARLLADCSKAPDGAAAQGLPLRIALNSVLTVDEKEVRNNWCHSAEDQYRIQAPIGSGPSGPIFFDLQQDGPHLLVAGTTGSGKSEFLRSLVVSLSMQHSPSKLNFLLVDFKGGSGLGPLNQLPHSVGMLTDLSAEGVGRTMDSLRAEVRRRESLFAKAGAADLASYTELRGVHLEALPHLAVVIDEYRMLLEEAPQALDQLLRIATLGRSLGLHLVMATQRPQGAVSADIRANVTTSVALRVQSTMESQDIIDSPLAAGISVETPGRAYLRRANESPQQFQSASTAELSKRSHKSNESFSVTTMERALVSPLGGESEKPDRESRSAALSRYVDAVSTVWNSSGEAPIRGAVLPPLPDQLDELPTGTIDPLISTSIGRSVPLGLLDVPSEQRQEGLIWEPAEHSHLALIGPPRSGLNSSIRHIVQHLWSREVRQMHMYILDAEGILPGSGKNVHVGAHVGADEIRRAARVLERLAESLSDRLRAGMAPPLPEGPDPDIGATDVRAEERPLIVLVVTGWGRWLSAIRNSSWPWVEDYVQDLIRDGHRAGIALMISGDRELATGRLLGMIPNRIYFPTGASPESLMMWPKLPSVKNLPGRAFMEGRFAPSPGIGQLIPCGDSSWRHFTHSESSKAGDRLLPFRVAALPEVVLPDAIDNSCSNGKGVTLGVQGDDLHPAVLQLSSAEVFLILGSRKSGKSTALELIASTGSPAYRWTRVSGSTLESRPQNDSLDGCEQIDAHPSQVILLVDDADQLSPLAAQNLMELNTHGYGIVMTAMTSPSVMTRIPLAMQARSTGKGIVLAPHSVMDGDFFGVRLDVEPKTIPGRAMLIDNAICTPAQLIFPFTDVTGNTGPIRRNDHQ